MSRASVVSNVLLVLVVAALAWALYVRTDGGNNPEKRMSADNSRRTVPPASGIDADTADRLATQLTRIDARLAALENGASRDGAIAPAAQPAAPVMSAAEADRRVRHMLTGPEIDHRALNDAQSLIAGLPPAEQQAMSLALARAINADQVRLRH